MTGVEAWLTLAAALAFAAAAPRAGRRAVAAVRWWLDERAADQQWRTATDAAYRAELAAAAAEQAARATERAARSEQLTATARALRPWTAPRGENAR